jgi:hypothetical protein
MARRNVNAPVKHHRLVAEPGSYELRGQSVQLRIRIKEHLHAELEESRRRRGLSMNGEVERRLQSSFTVDEALEAAQASFQMLSEKLDAFNRAQDEQVRVQKQMAEALDRVMDEFTVETLKDMKAAIRNTRNLNLSERGQ